MPAPLNLDEIVDWLKEVLDSFNFNLPGKDRNLGRDLAHVFAGQIAARSSTLKRGADEEEKWDPNEPGYKEWKRQVYGWPDDAPNYRTGQMLSQASLFGRTRIVADKLVELVYGLDEAPEDCYSPEDNRDASTKDKDESVTDVEKAEFNSAKRPFYEVDDEVEAAVIEAADEALAKYILQIG